MGALPVPAHAADKVAEPSPHDRLRTEVPSGAEPERQAQLHFGPAPDVAEPGTSTEATDVAPAGQPVAGQPVLVDPAVSQTKFEREIAAYRRLEADYRRRGWWVLNADFPNVTVAFVTPQLRPAAVVFAVRVNFENYDLWAPSVRFVDPFSGTPLRQRELPPTLQFARRIVGPTVEVAGFGPLQQTLDQPLLQSHGADELPFLCIPGVREYHEHSAHTGDDWFLHRGRGEGTLYFILEKLSRYGLERVQGYQLALQVAGFGFSPEVPT